MKIELTDKQVDNFLNDLPLEKLYTYLGAHPIKGFTLFKHLLLNKYNTESMISAIYNILEDVPIQKELF